jgi:hypothetical protein
MSDLERLLIRVGSDPSTLASAWSGSGTSPRPVKEQEHGSPMSRRRAGDPCHETDDGRSGTSRVLLIASGLAPRIFTPWTICDASSREIELSDIDPIDPAAYDAQICSHLPRRRSRKLLNCFTPLAFVPTTASALLYDPTPARLRPRLHPQLFGARQSSLFPRWRSAWQPLTSPTPFF